MTHHAGGRVVVQDAGDTRRRFIGTIADDNHPGVLREAHAYPAAVVQRHPGRAAGGIEQGVEQRPVGDRIRTIAHRFGFAVRAGDGAGVKVIPANDDRRGDFAAAHHFVKRQTEFLPPLQTDPADTRRQSLEADALARHIQPVVQMLIIFNDLFHFRVGFVDILRIAGQRYPAERADTAAEQRADIGRHEAREIEGVADAHFLRHLADVVAVVEGWDPHLMEGQHRLHVIGHRAFRRQNSALRVGFGFLLILFPAPAFRQIAMQRVVGAGLVGDHIRAHAALHQLRYDLRGVAAQRDRDGPPFGGVFFDARQGVIQRGGLLIHVAGTQTEIDAALLTFDIQRAGAGQRRGQRLRAAHAAQTGG